MTDGTHEPGRIDLRAIDGPADSLQADRVIAAALARRKTREELETDVPATIAAYARPLLMAAAALVAAASATLLLTRARAAGESTPPTAILAAWAETSHVPTNAELLAAFQEYGR
jgi:hypothetical protein